MVWIMLPLRLAAVVCAAVTLTCGTVSQEKQPDLTCAFENLTDGLDQIDEFADAIREARESRNVYQIYDAMTRLNKTISEMRSLCNPLRFEGDNQRVVGPITIPAGIYRVTATTDGFLIAEVETLSGRCHADDFFGLINVVAGGASDGVEARFNSEGCSALLTTHNVTAPWSIVFEKIQ
jgi:hypothetical protein